ncbi:hypothetical protein N7U49_05605 [Streptomyces sp. AD2-2]|nr:hypothetical protein N7U49_05605 [Streptomyces sp. AD2-2]
MERVGVHDPVRHRAALPGTAGPADRGRGRYPGGGGAEGPKSAEPKPAPKPVAAKPKASLARRVARKLKRALNK